MRTPIVEWNLGTLIALPFNAVIWMLALNGAAKMWLHCPPPPLWLAVLLAVLLGAPINIKLRDKKG